MNHHPVKAMSRVPLTHEYKTNTKTVETFKNTMWQEETIAYADALHLG